MPANRVATSTCVLAGTHTAAAQVGVPERTVRRWCQRHQLGQVVQGRRILTAADIDHLRRIMHDRAAAA
jgi:hypothetical protein